LDTTKPNNADKKFLEAIVEHSIMSTQCFFRVDLSPEDIAQQEIKTKKTKETKKDINI